MGGRLFGPRNFLIFPLAKSAALYYSDCVFRHSRLPPVTTGKGLGNQLLPSGNGLSGLSDGPLIRL